jgi:ribonuclease HI
LQEVIEIYTDGACCGNPGKGGWGVLIKKGDRYFEYGGFEEDTTNNRMEMTAAIEAMVEVADEEGPIRIYTDSQYLKKGITQWVHTWKINNWRTSGKEPVKNIELWQELDDLNQPSIQWEWVKGHGSNPYNCRVDRIARSFAEENPVELFKGEKVDASFFKNECKAVKTNDKKKKEENEPGEIASGNNIGQLSEKTEKIPETQVFQKDRQPTEPPGAKPVSTPEKTRVIKVCLPFIEKFADTLSKKGFKKDIPTDGDKKYNFSDADVRIDVFKSGEFILEGSYSRVDEMTSAISDADDRYLEKWINRVPLEFPGTPGEWKQKHFDAFVRPFYKKMDVGWKYFFEGNILKIQGERENRFEVDLDEEFSWKIPPPDSTYGKVKQFGESSVTSPDRFVVGLSSENTRYRLLIIPMDKHAVNLGQCRSWREMEDNFDRLDDSEKLRIIRQVLTHLDTVTIQSFNFHNNGNQGSGAEEKHKTISQWILEIINLYSLNYTGLQGKAPMDLIVETDVRDLIPEKMPAVKFSEKIGVRRPTDLHENSVLSLAGFILKKM